MDTSESEHRQNIEEFVAWLQSHGALFPKIAWPVYGRSSELEDEIVCRGAIAIEDIATNEHMIQIPYKLMMAPPQFLSHPVLGHAVSSSLELLQGDLLLAVYIMHELRLGKESFYYPYMKILPTPMCASEWNDEELRQLQDDKLFIRSKSRQNFLKNAYNRTIVEGLNAKFCDLFPLTDFTFDRFKFSWNTIQARAFGRRLPWTALVPFADCLNHKNVQTKYDFNVSNNEWFRLFPTGENKYDKGKEVFNSYGRRPNDNLLLDYGFSMIDNQWDEVEIMMSLPRTDSDFSSKILLARGLGCNLVEFFLLNNFQLPYKALSFARVVCANSKEIASAIPAALTEVEEIDGPDYTRRKLLFEINPFRRFFSSSNELKALQFLRSMIVETSLGFSTQATDDEIFLQRLQGKTGLLSVAELNSWIELGTRLDTNKATGESLFSLDCTPISTNDASFDSLLRVDQLYSAIVYRLTRKRILHANLLMIDTISDFLLHLSHRSREDNEKILDSIKKLFEIHNVEDLAPVIVRRTNYYLEDLSSLLS